MSDTDKSIPLTERDERGHHRAYLGGHPSNSTVYLCGGINGLSDTDCRDWREVAKSLLTQSLPVLDPMRRDYRGKEDESVREIIEGDLSDIRESRYILVNASKPSWGTAMELVYAKQWGKVIVAFTNGARVSPWLRGHSGTITETLAQAVDGINADAAKRHKVFGPNA